MCLNLPLLNLGSCSFNRFLACATSSLQIDIPVMFEAENSCKNLSLEFFSSCFHLIKSKFGWLVDQLLGCDYRHITPWGQTKWDQPLMGQAAEVTVAREEQVKSFQTC